jgi:hypothetical protein
VYTRLRLVAYSRSKVSAGYRTYSFTYYDDPGVDLVFGGKFDNDGKNITKGFSGFILEIRLFSNSALTIAQLDAYLDWDCVSSTMKLCDFCPKEAGIPNMCLEDLTGSGRVSGYLKA